MVTGQLVAVLPGPRPAHVGLPGDHRAGTIVHHNVLPVRRDGHNQEPPQLTPGTTATPASDDRSANWRPAWFASMIAQTCVSCTPISAPPAPAISRMESAGLYRLGPEIRACPSPNVARRLLHVGSEGPRRSRQSGHGRWRKAAATRRNRWLRRLHVRLPTRTNVQHVSGATICLVNICPPKAASDMSDCLRAVPQSNNLSFEYR